MDWEITASRLEGRIAIPPSKSQSMRALVFALMAKGRSRLFNLLPSPDIEAMLHACTALGAKILSRKEGVLEIEGVDGKIEGAEDVIQAGNSGLVLRVIGALCSLSPRPIVITGDHSIRHQRPIFPLLHALSQLGAEAVSTKGDGYAPIIVKGPIRSSSAVLDGKDSQPVSGLLIAGSFAKKRIELRIENPGEKPWVDLTLSWLDKLSIPYKREGHIFYQVSGEASYAGFDYAVPGDFSSAAFPLAAAVLTEGRVTLENLDREDPQGDKTVISLLSSMGASLQWEGNSLEVSKGSELHGRCIDVNDCIDALPILAVIGCCASGKTELIGGEIARTKECDRIHCIAKELRKMGAAIVEQKEGLIIYPSQLHGAVITSHQDHRIAMALTVAALAARGKTIVKDVGCIKKTFPHFDEEMQKLGAQIIVVHEVIKNQHIII